MEKNLTPKDYQFFRLIGLLVIALGWFSFALTLVGFFENWLAILGSIIIIGSFSYWTVSRKFFTGLSKESPAGLASLADNMGIYLLTAAVMA